MPYPGMVCGRKSFVPTSWRPALGCCPCPPLIIVLPVALLLQRVSHFLRHVGFVVLGQNAVCAKSALRIKGAFGNYALAFPEQIRKQALIDDRNRAVSIGHSKSDAETVAARDAALLDQAADAHAN